MITDSKNPRREFLGKLAAGAGTTLALPALFTSLNAEAAIEQPFRCMRQMNGLIK